MIKVKYKNKVYNIKKQYLEGLKGNDRTKQIKSIVEGKDTKRPETKFKSKRSGWVKKFEDKYKHKITDEKFIHENIITRTGQKKIKAKGIAAFKSGSRPNQNIYSWSNARLASVIMGGGARKIDINEWNKYKR